MVFLCLARTKEVKMILRNENKCCKILEWTLLLVAFCWVFLPLFKLLQVMLLIKKQTNKKSFLIHVTELIFLLIVFVWVCLLLYDSWTPLLTPRKNVPAKKDSLWLTGSKTITRASQPLLMRGCISGKAPRPGSHLLHCAPPGADPYKGVPGILFWPMGLSGASSNWSCRALTSFAPLLTNQNSSTMCGAGQSRQCYLDQSVCL